MSNLGEPFSALPAPAPQNSAACGSRHPVQKTVFVSSLAFGRLIGPFHYSPDFLSASMSLNKILECAIITKRVFMSNERILRSEIAAA